jgi:hypothetical protein
MIGWEGSLDICGAGSSAAFRATNESFAQVLTALICIGMSIAAFVAGACAFLGS